jgi:hypothetical protein
MVNWLHPPDPLEEDAPEKPKGMQWRTYERKLAAWTEAAQAADKAFAKWIGTGSR